MVNSRIDVPDLTTDGNSVKETKEYKKCLKQFETIRDETYLIKCNETPKLVF